MAGGAHHLRLTGAITEVEVYAIGRTPRPPRPDALMPMSGRGPNLLGAGESNRPRWVGRGVSACEGMGVATRCQAPSPEPCPH